MLAVFDKPLVKLLNFCFLLGDFDSQFVNAIENFLDASMVGIIQIFLGKEIGNSRRHIWIRMLKCNADYERHSFRRDSAVFREQFLFGLARAEGKHVVIGRHEANHFVLLHARLHRPNDFVAFENLNLGIEVLHGKDCKVSASFRRARAIDCDVCIAQYLYPRHRHINRGDAQSV